MNKDVEDLEKVEGGQDLRLLLLAWRSFLMHSTKEVEDLAERGFPDVGEVEGEAGEFRVAADGFGVFQEFGGTLGAIDLERSGLAIDEPAQGGTVGNVFFHLGLQARQGVAGRAQFDHKIGADRRE